MSLIIPIMFLIAVFFPINPRFDSESYIVFSCHISLESFHLGHFPSLTFHDIDICKEDGLVALQNYLQFRFVCFLVIRFRSNISGKTRM